MKSTFNGPLSYDATLHIFQDSLGLALSGAVPPPTSAMSDISLTLALLDIVHAVRSKRPTEGLVMRACKAFTVYAAQIQSDGLPDVMAVA